MAELKCCGYTELDRFEILSSGIKRYENLRRKEKDGVRPFYRKKNFERIKRISNKEHKKETWLQKSNNNY